MSDLVQNKYDRNNTFSFDLTDSFDFLHGRLRSPYCPVVLANEHLDNTSVANSCYTPVLLLTYWDLKVCQDLFEILSDEEVNGLDIEQSFRNNDKMIAHCHINGEQLEIDEGFITRLRDIKNSIGRVMTRDEIQNVLYSYIASTKKGISKTRKL